MFGFRSFLGAERSRESLDWWGAAIIVVVAALWTAFLHFSDLKSKVGEGKGGIEGDSRLLRLQEEADSLYRKGHESGANGALAAAIDHRRQIATLVPRDRFPLDWAATENNLGNAPDALGEREGGTARLQEAVAAFRAAQEE